MPLGEEHAIAKRRNLFNWDPKELGCVPPMPPRAQFPPCSHPSQRCWAACARLRCQPEVLPGGAQGRGARERESAVYWYSFSNPEPEVLSGACLRLLVCCHVFARCGWFCALFSLPLRLASAAMIAAVSLTVFSVVVSRLPPPLHTCNPLSPPLPPCLRACCQPHSYVGQRVAAGRGQAHPRADHDGHHARGVLLEKLPQPAVAHPPSGMGYAGLIL